MAVESDFSAFLAGEILAMPLTGNQVAKIRAGQSEGKYGDIRFLNAASYTDRVAYAVIPSSPRADGELRASAARAFIKMLTEEDAQNRLKKYHFFPTGITENLYEGVPGMAEIESALRRTDCVVNLSLTNDEIEAFWNGEISARELMRRLRNAPRPAAKLQ